jgi:hypothetical protein
MARWLGIVVSGDKVTAVDADVPVSGALVIQADHSWGLQQGERPAAYCVMHQRIANYVKENAIEHVVVKESALTMGSMKKAHLLSAELRGVVAAAASSVAKTTFVAKAKISRSFGSRKVDEYLKDDEFWAEELSGTVRVGSRESAMVLLAARKAK